MSEQRGVPAPQSTVLGELTPESVAARLATIKKGEVLVITINPHFTSVGLFVQVLTKAYELVPSEGWWSVGFIGVGDPVKSDLVQAWARELVDKHSEVLVHAINEKHAAESGMPVFFFPGAGLYRLVTMAGYGSWEHDEEGAAFLKLDAMGCALVGAFEHEGEPC